MYFQFPATAFGLGLLVESIAGTVIDVDVGSMGFTFDPDTVIAAVGDTLNFHFYPGDHSVAQSTFGAPCQPLSGGKESIYSGFINPSGSGEADTMFSMAVNSTDPIWLYCSQVSHCQAGMVMVVNPASGQTLDEYKNAAKTASTSSPAQVFGGKLEPNKDIEDSSTTVASSTMSMAASTSIGTMASSTMSSMLSATGASGTTTAAASSTSAASVSVASVTASDAIQWRVSMFALGLATLPVFSWLLMA